MGCDYCTEAHNDAYYEFYKHRVYEVRAQKYFHKERKKRIDRYLRFERLMPPIDLTKQEVDDDKFRELLGDFVKLHTKAWQLA